MHIQKIVSGIRELQVMHTESKNNEIRRKKARQKKLEAMIEEKEKDTDFYIEKMRLKKEKDRLIQKKILEREKEREEDREEEIDKARVRSKMELEKKNNKSVFLRASRGVTSAINASRLFILLTFYSLLSYFSLLCSSFYLCTLLSTSPCFLHLLSSLLSLPATLSTLHSSPFSLSPPSLFLSSIFPPIHLSFFLLRHSIFLSCLSFHHVTFFTSSLPKFLLIMLLFNIY